MMPDMDGWQVCKATREFSSVPILILSALDEPSIVASVLDIGADDFLVKPVPSAVLIAHLNKLVRRTETFHRFPHDRSRWHPSTQPLLPLIACNGPLGARSFAQTAGSGWRPIALAGAAGRRSDSPYSSANFISFAFTVRKNFSASATPCGFSIIGRCPAPGSST